MTYVEKLQNNRLWNPNNFKHRGAWGRPRKSEVVERPYRDDLILYYRNLTFIEREKVIKAGISKNQLVALKEGHYLIRYPLDLFQLTYSYLHQYYFPFHLEYLASDC